MLVRLCFRVKGSQRLVPSRYDHVFYGACWPNAPWQDPFPISPRNSVAAIMHLMKSTNSKYLVVSGDATLQKLADVVCRESVADERIVTISMPCFADLYSSESHSYQPLAPVRPEWSETAVVLHSSGTTRFPNPVYTTQTILLQNATRPCMYSQPQFRTPTE